MSLRSLTNNRLMQVKNIVECSLGTTFIKLPFAIKIFVLSIFEWPFYTGFTVCQFIFLIDRLMPDLTNCIMAY